MNSKDNSLTSKQHRSGILYLQFSLMLLILITPVLRGLRAFSLPQNYLDLVGMSLLVIGTSIVICALFAMNKSFTITINTRKGAKLITHFPFNLSRNPIYVAGLMMCLGWGILQQFWLTLLLTLLLAPVLHYKIRLEEEFLLKVFGEEYKTYKAKVRRYL